MMSWSKFRFIQQEWCILKFGNQELTKKITSTTFRCYISLESVEVGMSRNASFRIICFWIVTRFECRLPYISSHWQEHQALWEHFQCMWLKVCNWCPWHQRWNACIGASCPWVQTHSHIPSLALCAQLGLAWLLKEQLEHLWANRQLSCLYPVALLNSQQTGDSEVLPDHFLLFLLHLLLWLELAMRLSDAPPVLMVKRSN